jgi:hypothetical protein
MKAKLFLRSCLLSCMVALAFTSCKEDEEKITPELKYVIDGSSPTNLAVTANGVTRTVSVESNGAWSVVVSAGSPAWIQVSPDKGEKNGTVTMTVIANTSASNRTGTLTFVMDEKTLGTLTVIQSGFGAQLAVLPEAPEQTPAAGGVLEFSVAANTEWTYSLSAGAETWVTQTDKTDDVLKLRVIPNATVAEKTATITFSLADYSDVTQEVVISQACYAHIAEDFGSNATFTVLTATATTLKSTLEGLADGNYIVNIAGDMTLSDATGGEGSKSNITLNTSGVTISLRGSGNTVTPANDANIVRINEGKLILRDVTLSKAGADTPTVLVGANGELVIHEGVSIVGTGGNNNSGVRVEGGQFLMMGGEIHGHRTGSGGAGVFLTANGAFQMDGGEIYDNTAGYGGGIFINSGGGSFIMNGGELYDNHSGAGEGGGAVYVYKNGSVAIYPGATIYGETGSGNKAGNTAGGGAVFGHAVSAYYTDYTGKQRSTTIQSETLSITLSGGSETESSGTWESFPSARTISKIEYDSDVTLITWNASVSETHTELEYDLVGGGTHTMQIDPGEATTELQNAIPGFAHLKYRSVYASSTSEWFSYSPHYLIYPIGDATPYGWIDYNSVGIPATEDDPNVYDFEMNLGSGNVRFMTAPLFASVNLWPGWPAWRDGPFQFTSNPLGNWIFEEAGLYHFHFDLNERTYTIELK